MDGRRACCGFYRLGLALAAVVLVAFSVFSVGLVVVSLVRVEDEVPHLIAAHEMRTPRQHAFRLLFEWSAFRLPAFLAQQVAAVFVSVLLLIGALTNTPRLFVPFVWFVTAAIVLNVAEIGEVGCCILQLETHAEIDKFERPSVFRSLMQVAIGRLFLPLPLAWAGWTAMRASGSW